MVWLRERTGGYQASGRDFFYPSWGHLHGTTWTLSFLEGYPLRSLKLCLYTYTHQDTTERGEMVGIGRVYLSSTLRPPTATPHNHTFMTGKNEDISDTTGAANTIGSKNKVPNAQQGHVSFKEACIVSSSSCSLLTAQ